jgi:hypothetical protein
VVITAVVIALVTCRAAIDKIIQTCKARKALAAEHGRRERWQQVVENAAGL